MKYIFVSLSYNMIDTFWVIDAKSYYIETMFFYLGPILGCYYY